MGLRRRIIERRFRAWVQREVQPQRFAAFGAQTVIHPPLTVDRAESVSIGERSYVLAGSWLAFPAGNTDARLTIGAGTYLGRDLTVVCAASVSIGDDVMGSDRIYIADVEVVPAPGGAVLGPPRPVRIGDGVFLGTGATILPGVTVGARSLVAAGAVVDADVPENAVVAGNPARVVRRFDRASDAWVTDASA
jgi:acetyltransferase-like isoleucine patch superfamily enzyme